MLTFFCSPDTPEKVWLNLKQQLGFNLRKIIDQHASYVKCIRKCLKDKRVTAEQLCTDLLYLPAIYPHAERKPSLLCDSRTDLEKAATIDGIFIVLSKTCSFHDCHIFQWIVREYGLDQGQEELKYPKYLKAYMESHKVSEFIQINPLLKKFADSSNPLTFKFDIESTCTLADLDKLKLSVTNILGLKEAALHLLDIDEGCITVTYHISPSIAGAIFTSDKKFTTKLKEFQALSVKWMEYGGHTYTFEDNKSDGEDV